MGDQNRKFIGDESGNFLAVVPARTIPISGRAAADLALANLSVNECHEKAREHIEEAIAYVARAAANTANVATRAFFFDLGKALANAHAIHFVKTNA